MKRIDALVTFVVIGALLIVAGAILYFRPFYGLMDDHTNLYAIYPQLRADVWSELKRWLLLDLEWGMFRIWYLPLVGLLHWFGELGGPLAFFFVNYFLAIAAYGLPAFVLARRAGLSFWRVALVMACVYHGYDIFQHPSLQEKLILLFAAPLLWFAGRSDGPGLFWRTLACAAIAVVGAGTKTSFLVYMSAAWVAFVFSLQFEPRRRAVTALLFLTVVFAGIFAGYVWVSAQGSYTTAFYTKAKIPANLMSPTGLLLLLAAISALYFAGRERFASRTAQGAAVASVAVLAYLAIFLAWGVSGYLVTLIVPAVAVSAVYALERVVPANRAYLWLVPAIVVAIAFSGYRSVSMFSRLADIRILVSNVSSYRALGMDHLVMPCFEGAEAMKKYFRYAGGEVVTIEYKADPEPLDGSFLLYDQGLCALPGRRAEFGRGCIAESLYASGFSRGFRLIRLRCQEN